MHRRSIGEQSKKIKETIQSRVKWKWGQLNVDRNKQMDGIRFIYIQICKNSKWSSHEFFSNETQKKFSTEIRDTPSKIYLNSCARQMGSTDFELSPANFYFVLMRFWIMKKFRIGYTSISPR